MGVMLYESMETYLFAHRFYIGFWNYRVFPRIKTWENGLIMKFMSLYIHSESFITTSIMLGATKVGEVWAMLCISLLLVAYLMLKRHKIEALFFALTMALSGILNPALKIYSIEKDLHCCV